MSYYPSLFRLESWWNVEIRMISKLIFDVSSSKKNCKSFVMHFKLSHMNMTLKTLSISSIKAINQNVLLERNNHNVLSFQWLSFIGETKEEPLKLISLPTVVRKITNQSIMRRSVATEMDKFDKRSKIERIRARRGSFKSLPVFFSNDLVHGSWWLSIAIIIIALSPNYFFLLPIAGGSLLAR